MDIIKKVWDWMLVYLPTVWGILLVGAVTTGLLALMAATIRLLFQAM